MQYAVFEIGLAIALMAAATLIAGRLKLSVIPLLILIGLAVGPHMPHVGMLDLRFIESKSLIDFLGRLGIIFLLFSLGLEFSVGRLVRAGGSIVVGSIIYIGITVILGFSFGWVAGFPIREVLVIVGIMLSSSSAIVAKSVIDLRRSARPESGLILGITMTEDVALALYIAIVSGFVVYHAVPGVGVIVSVIVPLVFLLSIILVGRYSARFLNRRLGRLADEAFLLLVVAVLFVVAGLGEAAGITEAIVALLMGLVVAETGHAQRMQRLASPLRELFGAFFFFSFGLNIDPLELGGAAVLAVGGAAVTIGGAITSGIIVGQLLRLRASARLTVGLTLISRGEFSIVVASLATSAGLLTVIQPFAALYVLVLSILGPILARESDSIYQALYRFVTFVNTRGGRRPQPAAEVDSPDSDDAQSGKDVPVAEKNSRDVESPSSWPLG